MKRITIVLQFIFALLLGTTQVFAQGNGKVTGKVTDRKSGEALIGVTVIVQGTSTGAVTDVEGRYNISVKAGTYTLQVKYIGYQTKEISEVIIKAGQVTNLDMTLDEPKSEKLNEVVIKGSARTETLNSLLTFQKNTNTVAQVVSAETIRKSPDRNTSEVLKRVSGASMQDGKYLVVRGLADRYNQAMVNGALMSSTEPDRKTFSFDLFPSAIIDNIIINKAATPEMPAEFAGGLVQINTKDVPDENFFTISVGTGYNTSLSGEDFKTYKGGKLDFFGLDDGDRKLGSSFPSSSAVSGGNPADNAELGKSLNDVWGLTDKSVPLNGSAQIAGGFTKRLDGQKGWGGVFALNYNKQNRVLNVERNYYELDESPEFLYRDKVFVQNLLLGGLANFTYRTGSSKISWKNSYNISSNDQTTTREGQDIDSDRSYDIRSQELSFVSNKLYNTQLIGEHLLRGSNIKIKWNGNFALTDQDIPDLRRLKYTSLNSDGNYGANIQRNTGSPRNAGRFYSDLQEILYGGSAEASKTFKVWGRQQQVKIGGLYQRKDRDFNARALAIIRADNAVTEQLINLPPDQILAKENYGPDKFYLDDLTSTTDSYTAYSNLGAGFLQFDNQFGDKWRLVWGARIEYFLQHLESANVIPSQNSKTDVLPSLNLTYMLNASTNIRLAASQTVARPEFREIAPFSFYDFERNGIVLGNRALERTKISNVDLRYEIYPKAGEVLTIGAFFKYFDKPIETNYFTSGGSPTFSYQNAKSATSLGIELEFRKKLDFLNSSFLDNFAIFANGALIKSEVKFPESLSALSNDRPMFGQSPYLINAGLQYDNTEIGLNASVLFNVIGRRIAQVGNADFPDIWESPRPLLDFQVTKKLGKNSEVKLSASDILNRPGSFYWEMNDNKKYDAGKDYLINRFRYGTNLSVQYSYRF